MTHGENEILLRLVAAVGDYWNWHGFAREFRSWVAIALDRGASPRHARMKVLRLAIGRAHDDRARIAKREEEPAAHLLGAAAALRAELEIGMIDPFEEQINERAVADARAAPGEAAVTAPWTRGEAMTLEEIIAFTMPA